MKSALLVFLLGIESSYIDNIERRTEGFGDTVQWHISEDRVFRTKTYAIDNDIHIMEPARGDWTLERWLELAEENTVKHYGDVIVDKHEFYGVDGENIVQELNKSSELGPGFEIQSTGQIVWIPDGETYTTQSTPE